MVANDNYVWVMAIVYLWIVLFYHISSNFRQIASQGFAHTFGHLEIANVIHYHKGETSLEMVYMEH